MDDVTFARAIADLCARRFNEPWPGLKADEDLDFRAAQVIEGVTNGLNQFLIEQRPEWTPSRAVATQLIALDATFEPAAKYNGVDYDLLWYEGGDHNKPTAFGDWGLGSIVSHLADVANDPDNYGCDTWDQGLGELSALDAKDHGGRLQVECAPPGTDTSRYLGGQPVGHLEAAARELHRDLAAEDEEYGAKLAEYQANPNDEAWDWLVRYLAEGIDQWLEDGLDVDLAAEALRAELDVTG